MREREKEREGESESDREREGERRARKGGEKERGVIRKICRERETARCRA